MNSKLIVEVTSEACSSTIALAAAAQQFGGKLLCILPKPITLDKSQKIDNYERLLERLNVNRKRSVVVANNLIEGRKRVEGHLKGVETMVEVQFIKRPIGKGMEITMLGRAMCLEKENKTEEAIIKQSEKDNP
ncbi:unnamed protein product [Fraxinus pennsylvanica]|uniref:Uncharacterized protein n=1 Tax=Fraxinus pennsylvanica TaxID=56036 RepID=A0AAD2A8G9_9LAMI|nr:unnamed protein product [Fraxinus pennsylvanica]